MVIFYIYVLNRQTGFLDIKATNFDLFNLHDTNFFHDIGDLSMFEHLNYILFSLGKINGILKFKF